MLTIPAGGELDWVSYWGEDKNDIVGSICVDDTGIYVPINSGDNSTIVKYNKEGDIIWNKSVRGWNKKLGKMEFVHINSIGIDNEAIYIGGNTRLHGYDFRSYEPTSFAFIAKFDKNGHHIWNITWDGNSYHSSGNIFSLTISEDYIYATGWTINNAIGGWDSIVWKYDKDGNLIWYRTWGGPGREEAHCIYVYDESIYITGETERIPENDKAFLIKFDTNGNMLWLKTWGDNYTVSFSIVVDGDNIYATGVVAFKNIGRQPFLMKFDSNGNIIWNKICTDGVGNAYSLFVDDNSIYVVGDIKISNSNYNYYDVLIMKYDKNGNKIWHKTWGESSYESAWSVFVENKNLYVVGRAEPKGIADDIFILKYEDTTNLLNNESTSKFDLFIDQNLFLYILILLFLFIVIILQAILIRKLTNKLQIIHKNREKKRNKRKDK